MEIIGAVASVASLTAGVTTVATTLNNLKERYQYAPLNVTLVAGSLWTVKAALEAIEEWRKTTKDSSKTSEQLDEDLALSLQACACLISVIDRKLKDSDITNLTTFNKAKFVALDAIFKDFTANLDTQVRGLQLLLQVYQCRTLTERTETLQRRDTRKVFRQVEQDTLSLDIEDSDLTDAASILSDEPSVNFEVDHILLNSPLYRRVYGSRYIAKAQRFSKELIASPRASLRPPSDDEAEGSRQSTHKRHRSKSSTGAPPAFLGAGPDLPFLGVPFQGEVVADDSSSASSTNTIPARDADQSTLTGLDTDVLPTHDEPDRADRADRAQPEPSSETIKDKIDLPADPETGLIQPTGQKSPRDAVSQHEGIPVQSDTCLGENLSGSTAEHAQIDADEISKATEERAVPLAGVSLSQAEAGSMALSESDSPKPAVEGPEQEAIRPEQQALQKPSTPSSETLGLPSTSDTGVNTLHQGHELARQSAENDSQASNSVEPTQPSTTSTSSSTALDDDEDEIGGVRLSTDRRFTTSASVDASNEDHHERRQSVLQSPPPTIIEPQQGDRSSNDVSNAQQPVKTLNIDFGEDLAMGIAASLGQSTDSSTPIEEQDKAKHTSVEGSDFTAETMLSPTSEDRKPEGDPAIVDNNVRRLSSPSSPIQRSASVRRKPSEASRRSFHNATSSPTPPQLEISTAGSQDSTTSQTSSQALNTSPSPTTTSVQTRALEAEALSSKPLPPRPADVDAPARPPPPVPTRKPPPVPPELVLPLQTNVTPDPSPQLPTRPPVPQISPSTIASPPSIPLPPSPQVNTSRDTGLPSIQTAGMPQPASPESSLSPYSPQANFPAPADLMRASESIYHRSRSETSTPPQARHQSDNASSVGSVTATASNDSDSTIDAASVLSSSTSQSHRSSSDWRSASGESYQTQLTSALSVPSSGASFSTMGIEENASRQRERSKISASLTKHLGEGDGGSQNGKRVPRLRSFARLSGRFGSDRSSRLKTMNEAAAAGNVSILETTLLDSSIRDVQASIIINDDREMKTPLMRAAAGGHVECMERLVKAGADFAVTDSQGRIALHHAIINNQLIATQWLAERFRLAASTPGHPLPPGPLEIVNKGGQSSLAIAARYGHVDVMQVLITSGAKLEGSDRSNSTALFTALSHGRLDAVRVLITAGANVNHQNNVKETPLMYAARAGSREAIELLIEAKANRSMKDENGDVVLHHAVRHGHLDVVDALYMSLEDLEAKNNIGERPLHVACARNHPNIVKALLQIGCIANAWTEPRGKKRNGVTLLASTPLHYACRGGYYDCAEAVIRHGALVNSCQEDGTSPLYMACEARDLATVSLLLESGANVNASRETDRMTALHVSAAGNDTLDIVKQLLDFGANPRMCNKKDETPAFHAIATKTYDRETIRYLSKHSYQVATQTYGRNSAAGAPPSARPPHQQALPSVPSEQFWQPVLPPQQQMLIQQGYPHVDAGRTDPALSGYFHPQPETTPNDAPPAYHTLPPRQNPNRPGGR